MKKRQVENGKNQRGNLNNVGSGSDDHIPIKNTKQRTELAKIAKTSEGSIYRSKQILDKGTPEQIELLYLKNNCAIINITKVPQQNVGSQLQGVGMVFVRFGDCCFHAFCLGGIGMIIDKLVLINGEVFEEYTINEAVPQKEGFIVLYKPESDCYTRYININHILYAEIKNGKIEKQYEDFNAGYMELIDKFTKM